MSLGPAYVADVASIQFGEYMGVFDASSGAFPVAINQGDWFNVTVAGTVDSQAFVVGDIIIALVEAPSTSTFAGNWTIVPAPTGAGVSFPLLAPDGTAAAPSYSFTSDPDTGIYLAAVNELGFSTGGVLKATLTAAGRLGIGTPTPAAPLEVVGDQPGVVGGFQAGAFQVRGDGTAQFSNAVITGHSSFNGNTQLWYIGSASSSNDDILILNRQNGSISFSTNNIARFVMQADGTVKIVNKIENAVGTAALPSYSFTGDPDLGIFRVSADRIGISSNGALRWDVSANFITTTLNTRGPDSTALLPTYSFASDPDTGVFNVSADVLGLTAGGVQIAQAKEAVGANQFIIAPGVIQNNAAAPSLAFGDGDTGFFETLANILAVTVSGGLHFLWQANTFRAAASRSATLIDVTPSATVPTYTFEGDPDTGIGSAAADQLSLIAGGVQVANLTETAGVVQFVLRQQSTEANPTLGFGDGDSGFYETLDDIIVVSLAGSNAFVWQDNAFRGALTGSPKMVNELATAINPVFVFEADEDTGLGSATADQLNLIAGGLTCMSVSEVGGARRIGFYEGSPIALQTGVAVTTAAIHAALVNLRLITA